MSPRPRAILVAVQTPDRTDADLAASLDELDRLCDTLGLESVGRLTQRRRGTGGATLLGPGRLVELAEWTGGTGEVSRGPMKLRRNQAAEPEEEEELEEDDHGEAAPEIGVRATVVVADHELSPSQLRNIQQACGVEVLDRTGVILEIFHRHARSREARLQVEIARLQYTAPRLREAGGATQRQGGGIGAKGSGESDLELDRRRVRDRISELRRELVHLATEREVRRDRRQDQRQVALVGYTNAGKSSLVRALTGAEVLIANRLFATLDTTIRRLSPAASPDILVTDTVGFIRDLPHSLVASFRSTLEAALDASLLLQVVDVGDPEWRRQAEVTTEVLREIGAGDLPRQLVLNQCDRLPEGVEEALAAEFPDAWRTSAKDPLRVADLHRHILGWFGDQSEEAEIFVPWKQGAVVGMAHQSAEVLTELHEEEGTRLSLRAPSLVMARLRAALEG